MTTIIPVIERACRIEHPHKYRKLATEEGIYILDAVWTSHNTNSLEETAPSSFLFLKKHVHMQDILLFLPQLDDAEDCKELLAVANTVFYQLWYASYDSFARIAYEVRRARDTHQEEKTKKMVDRLISVFLHSRSTLDAKRWAMIQYKRHDWQTIKQPAFSGN